MAEIASPLVKLGRLWFQYRSFTPLPLFFLMVVLPPEAQLSWQSRTLFVALIFLAEGFRVWAVGYAGSSTRTRGIGVREFVHAGPWRCVRNPLYLANMLMYCACSLLFGFRYLTLLFLVYFILQYSLIVSFEEELLAQTFGVRYKDYVARVPRWFFVPVWRYPQSSHLFDIRAALRSERSTLFAMAAMGGVLALKEWVFL